MAVKFGLAPQCYRLQRDPRIGMKYEPLTEADVQTFNADARAIDERLDIAKDHADVKAAEREAEALQRTLVERIVMLIGPDGECIDDRDDIIDTVLSSPIMAMDFTQAIRSHAFVSEDEAPFSQPPSTGR